MELQIDTAAQQVQRFVEEELPALKYPEGQFTGRGIVIAAGGRKYLINAWVTINMLRRLGCWLPVQCWYLGPSEFDADWANLVRPLDVFCVDAYQVRDSQPGSWSHRHERLHGWELKPYAITHSPFQEVLFLDADNVPVVDPTFLFETPEFYEHGAIFWPDYCRLSADRLAWRVFGDIPYRDEPEFESGQILLDKRRTWSCLMLCHWYMQNSNNFFFHHVHGDKEIFHLAWRRLEQSYAMPSRGIHGLPGVMCQHDFQRRRIFQHRNMRKWTLATNPATAGFQYELECLEYLADLRRQWSPVIHQIQRLPKEDRTAMEAAVGPYIYERVGYDQRMLSLDHAGFVGEGVGGREMYWYIEKGRLILIAEDSEVTALLVKNASGLWLGRWERDEQMPILMQPNPTDHKLTLRNSRCWTPITSLSLGLSKQDRAAMENHAGCYEYERVGFDRRMMMLLCDGLIGKGSATCEVFWYIKQGHLIIATKKNSVTTSLTQREDGVWRGKWKSHERMPVILRRQSSKRG